MFILCFPFFGSIALESMAYPGEYEDFCFRFRFRFCLFDIITIV
jgi:hypothetical protein